MDVFEIAAKHAPSHACRRAINDRRAVVEGRYLDPEDVMYFLVAVTSASGRAWILYVYADEKNLRWNVTTVVRIPKRVLPLGLV